MCNSIAMHFLFLPPSYEIMLPIQKSLSFARVSLHLHLPLDAVLKIFCLPILPTYESLSIYMRIVYRNLDVHLNFHWTELLFRHQVKLKGVIDNTLNKLP